MADTDALAERMIRAETAFTQNVIEGRSLRDIAPELGYSHETIRQDVASYKTWLADQRSADLQERRAVFEQHLDDVWRKAMWVFETYKHSKPLVAVGALNSAIATMTHKRAVQGLDEPKEARVQADVTYHVVWDEGEEAPALPAYAGSGLPVRDF